MTQFEQAALLATSWANQPTISAMAVRHSIVVAPPAKNKKITRSHLAQMWRECLGALLRMHAMHGYVGVTH